MPGSWTELCGVVSCSAEPGGKAEAPSPGRQRRGGRGDGVQHGPRAQARQPWTARRVRDAGSPAPGQRRSVGQPASAASLRPLLCPAVFWSDFAGPGICSGALRAVSLHDVHCSDQGRKPRSQKGRSPLIPIPRISKCSKGCGVCFPPMLLETFSKKRRGRAVGRALPLRFLASSLSRKCRRPPTLGRAGRVLPLSSEAYPEATRGAFLCVLRFPPDAGVRSGRFALSTLGSA